MGCGRVLCTAIEVMKLEGFGANCVSAAPKLFLFTLSHAAAADTIQISLNGVVLTAAEFTYNQATASVIIMVTVQTDQDVEIQYKENKPLRSEFFAGQIRNPSTIRCFLTDGSELHGFTYDRARQSIVFTTPPIDSVLFDCVMTL